MEEAMKSRTMIIVAHRYDGDGCVSQCIRLVLCAEEEGGERQREREKEDKSDHACVCVCLLSILALSPLQTLDDPQC